VSVAKGVDMSERGVPSVYCVLQFDFQPGYAHGLGSLQFPNGSSPVVSRTSVYTGNNLAESRSPALPLCCYHNHLYMEKAEVLRERLHTRGIRLHLFTEGMLYIAILKKKRCQITSCSSFIEEMIYSVLIINLIYCI
jgi:hypothetical protein